LTTSGYEGLLLDQHFLWNRAFTEARAVFGRATEMAQEAIDAIAWYSMEINYNLRLLRCRTFFFKKFFSSDSSFITCSTNIFVSKYKLFIATFHKLGVKGT
jgi:hypothetical protein